MQPIDLVKTSAWRIAFWPLVASSTSRTSCGAPGILRCDDVADLLQLAHQVGLGVQPAGGVDDQDVDAAGQGAVAGVVGDARRVGPGAPRTMSEPGALGPDRRAGRPPRRGRCRRRPSRIVFPSSLSRWASLAIEVVLPEPLTPAIR